jgi:ribose/xylose/arabinose/galactoside ABC-type transport system permease subunit
MTSPQAALARPTNRLRSIVEENRELVTIYSILLALVIIAAFLSPNFRTGANITNVARQAVTLGLVSAGQTVVILAGGIDLSVGATISLINVYTAGLMQKWPAPALILPIVLLMLALSVLIGFVNGTVVTRLKVAPFIATMGVGAIVQGLVLLYAKRPVGRISPGFNFFAEGMIGPIPFPVIFLALLFIATAFFLRRTVLGRHLVASGGSEVVARLSGVRTRRVITFAFMFCTFTAALSALFLTSRMAVGEPQIGGLYYDRYDLDSIAAVLVGGTRLGGGKGSVVGTLAGVLIVSVLNNIFNLINVSTYYQWIVKGLIILGAVALYTTRRAQGAR